MKQNWEKMTVEVLKALEYIMNQDPKNKEWKVKNYYDSLRWDIWVTKVDKADSQKNIRIASGETSKMAYKLLWAFIDGWEAKEKSKK